MVVIAHMETHVEPCRGTGNRRGAMLVNQNKPRARWGVDRQRQLLGWVEARRAGYLGEKDDCIGLADADPGPFIGLFICDIHDEFGSPLQFVQPVEDRLVADRNAREPRLNVSSADDLSAPPESLSQMPDKRRRDATSARCNDRERPDIGVALIT